MSALNLPKPKVAFAGEDELRKMNINGHGSNGVPAGNGEVEDGVRVSADEEYVPPRGSDKYLNGIIYPPREIRGIVDKTAIAISKSPHPKLLEDKIREHQKADPKFAFLNDEDPYHIYYRYMREKVIEDAEDIAKGIVPAAQAAKAAAEAAAEEAQRKEDEEGVYEPKSWEFRVDLPGVTAMDLDILRLTALFHARRGRAFLSSLSVREGRNYQFDFLRPTHSLYGYYNRMVESYQKIITPPPGQIETIIKEASDPRARWSTLDEARNRAEWERRRRRREDAKQKEKDEEAEAMGEIDWQDFVLVETIEFTQTDIELNLPPPSSIEDLRNRSMGEKRMASMIMEESANGTGVGTGGGKHAARVEDGDNEEMDMEEEDGEEEEDEELRIQRIKAEQEQARARDVQRAAMESRGMKIKKDYVPKGITRTGAVATSKCPNCGQSIPENELSEHIRIELLDPKWKEQKRVLDTRRAQHQQLNQGADITTSLRNLAAARTDLFGDDEDEATRKAREEEEKKKRKEREKIIWDGHTNSASGTEKTFQSNFNLDEQIKSIHSRKGLTDSVPAGAAIIGPTAGGYGRQPVEQPQSQSVYDGATISAAPTGPTQKEYYETVDGSRSAAGSAPSIHPSRMAAISAGGPDEGSAPVYTPPPPSMARPPPPQQIIGQTRPAEAMEEPQPVVKRQRVEKLAFGLYTEVDWMSLNPHPITLSIQLPLFPSKPEWSLLGQTIPLSEITVNLPFGALRERIKRALGAGAGDLPISRMQLSYEGRVMNNSATLAGSNIGEGDVVHLALKKK